MTNSTDSTLSVVAKGLGIAAAAAVGIGLGLLYAGPGGRRSRTAHTRTPSIDTGAAVAALLDRLDRIEARLTHLDPVKASVANLESRLQQHEKDIEAIQLRVNDAQQKEMDAEIARLGALLVEMKHPLFTPASELTH